MKLTSLRLQNFRIFEDITLDFQPDYTLLVGKNGAGKTTVLEGAAVALGTLFYSMSGASSLGIKKDDARLQYFPVGAETDVQSQYPVIVKATGEIDEREIAWTRSLNSEKGNTTIIDAKPMVNFSAEFQKRLQEGDPSLTLPVVAYYGTGRLWDYHRERRSNTFENSTRSNGYMNCLDGTANIKLMLKWFEKKTVEKYQRIEEALGDIPELEAVYHAMETCFKLFTGYNQVRIQYKLGTGQLVAYYTDDKGLRVKIALSQMSDGYKGILSLVADIAYRMAVLNPQLADEVLIKTDGIVMIDELDLHLHPAWQQQAISNLTAIFPKVQFIFTTHAPAMIGSVDSEHLRILESNSIKNADSQTFGKDVNSILREVMGAEERPIEFVKLFEEFYRLLNEREYDQADNILEQIARKRDFHDEEVAQCRVKLRLERIRGGKK